MVMDNSSSEYLFIWEFFTVKGENTTSYYLAIFEPVLTFIQVFFVKFLIFVFLKNQTFYFFIFLFFFLKSNRIY